MAGRLPTADDVISVVDDLIAKLGSDAFGAIGYIQLYSGPKDAVLALAGKRSKNYVRASVQAGTTTSTLIDNTNVGKFLGTYGGTGNIYAYFSASYVAHTKRAFVEADKVMRHVSRAFIRAAFGHAATAVCGAATERVFFQVELPELIGNARIETVNGIDMTRVRAIYRNEGAYAAFRKVCQAEVAMAYKRAKRESTQAAWNDYAARRAFFMAERKLTIRADAKAKTTAKSRARQVAVIRLAKASASLGSGPSAPAGPAQARKIGGTGLH